MSEPVKVHATALVDAGAQVGRWNSRLGLHPHPFRSGRGRRLQHLRPRLHREGVRIGDRVTVKSGVQLWDGITLEDDVFVGPNATFTNDLFPRSRERPHEFARTLVRHRASVGANATILAGRTSARTR